VRIPLHHQLLAWRGDLAEGEDAGLRWSLRLAHQILRRPALYRVSTRLGRRLARWLPVSWLEAASGAWSRERSLPAIPAQSFREWHAQRRRPGEPSGRAGGGDRTSEP
jgi:L-lactate dehydrogenase complex protein LldF